MSKLVRLLLALGALVTLCGITLLVGLLVLSGGNPGGFLRTSLIRFQLAGREGEINSSIGTSTDPIRFVINAGDAPRTIAGNLVAQNLITDAELFVDYVRVNGFDTQLEAGTYFLQQSQTLAQIASALTDSRSSQFPFRILEGWRSEEIAAAIDDNPYFPFSGADFLAVVGPGAIPEADFAAFAGLPAGASLEGFLFPNSYQLPAQVTPPMLRDILTREFRLQVGEQAAMTAGSQGRSLFDVVRLASIVQREAVRVDEMPLIASAYQNRLDIGMKMDADPTVQYAIGFRGGSWWPQITQADYASAPGPFNTYIFTGLPPGAIGNPGLSAINAALSPQQSPYFYFRARCDGSGYHSFAVTFEEHLANAC